MILGTFNTNELLRAQKKRTMFMSNLRAKLQNEFSLDELKKTILKLDKDMKYSLDSFVEELKANELIEINTLFSNVKYYQFSKERK
ncbi:hypothetical protein AVANS_0727 [Campylobacter sp. RM5004]|uniref:hypothetical protein n=1 Tax=Campylobacter sp. RM5004 TaxID=1660078 RepID=UPI001EFA5B50|nr:hypothetical protein [Campylobacter sp. RM5004]ULO01357.1 hypothetical protein AVANS_0727 [Campylobacter sp. RM5004]